MISENRLIFWTVSTLYMVFQTNYEITEGQILMKLLFGKLCVQSFEIGKKNLHD